MCAAARLGAEDAVVDAVRDMMDSVFCCASRDGVSEDVCLGRVDGRSQDDTEADDDTKSDGEERGDETKEDG